VTGRLLPNQVPPLHHPPAAVRAGEAGALQAAAAGEGAAVDQRVVVRFRDDLQEGAAGDGDGGERVRGAGSVPAEEGASAGAEQRIEY
jgi:hypothetical protein